MSKKKKLTAKQHKTKQKNNYEIIKNIEFFKKNNISPKEAINENNYIVYQETGKRPQTKEQRQAQVISRQANRITEFINNEKYYLNEISSLRNELEKVKLMLEDFRKMLFGAKKKDKNKDNDNSDNNKINHNGRDKRSTSSYQRSKPKPEEITDTQKHTIDCCPDCGTELTRLKIIERFIEDILPMKEWFRVLKKVTRLLITTGYCKNCKKRKEAKPIPKSVVSIGDNVKKFLVFSNVVLQLSYEQIADLLTGTIHFDISDGEIANVLEKESGDLKPEFERIKQSIRGQPGSHFDETTWNILQHEYLSKKQRHKNNHGNNYDNNPNENNSFIDEKEKSNYGNYAWVMTGIENTDAIFQLGRNRGMKNINTLAGDDYDGVGISDDYNGYKNTFAEGKHALCWAHPHRKIRDIKDSDQLSSSTKEHCEEVYNEFAKLYAEVREICARPFEKSERLKEKERLIPIFKNIATPYEKDPEKIKKIKARLLEQMDCYFTCIIEPNIPPDNNKAERAIRHLVIKRKKTSGGSKSKKGADVMSILYSVVLSLWRRNKENFFNAYDEALVGG